MIERKCKSCSAPFPIDDLDLRFFQKIATYFSSLLDTEDLRPPLPSQCPECRQQRRLAFRNERNLYSRLCDLCRKRVIGLYSPDKEEKVFCPDCWWSDRWDPLDYGQAFDFTQPFFPQWQALWRAIPKLNLILLGENQNSDYTNDNYRLKNCYLVFDGEQAVDCLYGETFSHLKDCVDFHTLQSCQFCYECLNSINCYELKYSRYCQNCSFSYFLSSCISCEHCFGCSNLVHKKYHIFNQPYSEEDYQRKLSSFDLGNYHSIGKWRAECEAFFSRSPQKYLHGQMNDNVTGENLNSCKDTFDTFDSRDLRDCRYCTNLLMGATDCWDLNVWGDKTSVVYNSACIGAGMQGVIGSYYSWASCSGIIHSAFCSRDCHNVFGSAGLRHNSYCFFNRIFSPSEWRSLTKRAVQLMQDTGEWGEFFPPQLSAFGYNETVAQEYFPLSKEEAISKNFRWSDYESEPPSAKSLSIEELPAAISDVSDDILSIAIKCPESGRLFRLTKQELQFYRSRNIPVPHVHPDMRHWKRLRIRNPRRLWNRNCSSCSATIVTTYSPERPEPVYCESCFNEAFRR